MNYLKIVTIQGHVIIAGETMIIEEPKFPGFLKIYRPERIIIRGGEDLSGGGVFDMYLNKSQILLMIPIIENVEC